MRTLFKFVARREAVIAIARGSLKFSRVEELNDPSELIPFMNHDAVKASLAMLRQAGYTQEQFNWLACQEATLRLLSPETKIFNRPRSIELANSTLALPIYDDLTYMERQLLQTISFIRSRVGVLSLTERFDSLPMWAHYADNARGYVLQFEGLEEDFGEDRTGSLNSLKPVRYVTDFEGMTHDPSTQDNLFFSKLRDWSYEREWRVVSALSDCRFDANIGLHLRSVDPIRIRRIICGWNILAEEVQALANDLARINAAIDVVSATFNRGRVEIR